MRPAITTTLCCLVLVCACGGNDNGNGPDLDDCLLDITLTGGLSENLEWNLQAGCGGSARDDQINLGFGILVTDLNIQVRASGVLPGELKTGLAGQVHIKHKDGREWTTEADACQVDIHENMLVEQDQVGDHYRVGGSGTCSGSAQPVPDNPSEPVHIPDFAFRATILW